MDTGLDDLGGAYLLRLRIETKPEMKSEKKMETPSQATDEGAGPVDPPPNVFESLMMLFSHSSQQC